METLEKCECGLWEGCFLRIKPYFHTVMYSAKTNCIIDFKFTVSFALQRIQNVSLYAFERFSSLRDRASKKELTFANSSWGNAGTMEVSNKVLKLTAIFLTNDLCPILDLRNLLIPPVSDMIDYKLNFNELNFPGIGTNIIISQIIIGLRLE